MYLFIYLFIIDLFNGTVSNAEVIMPSEENDIII